MRDGVVALCEGADLVIYDTQFTPEEYAPQPHWGHSCPDDAIEIAREAGSSGSCCSTTRPSAPTIRSTRILAQLPQGHAATAIRSTLVSGATKGIEMPRWGTQMKVRFWGVRGSIPAPGPETNRYGGNTSCVAVRDRRGRRSFIIDMGTGAHARSAAR